MSTSLPSLPCTHSTHMCDYIYVNTCTSYTLGCPGPWSWHLLHMWCDWPKAPHGETDYMLVQTFLSLPYINGSF